MAPIQTAQSQREDLKSQSARLWSQIPTQSRPLKAQGSQELGPFFRACPALPKRQKPPNVHLLRLRRDPYRLDFARCCDFSPPSAGTTVAHLRRWHVWRCLEFCSCLPQTHPVSIPSHQSVYQVWEVPSLSKSSPAVLRRDPMAYRQFSCFDLERWIQGNPDLGSFELPQGFGSGEATTLGFEVLTLYEEFTRLARD